jgi:3-phosphoshikimate 1-carboxyvinyltransferase
VTSARFEPSGPLRGTLRPPPDKSISHRAAIVGAMCAGETEVVGYLDAADTRATLGAIKAVGAEVDPANGAKFRNSRNKAPDGDRIDVSISGGGLYRPSDVAGTYPVEIDVGNAGTLLRILPGWLAGQRSGTWTLAGDESIAKRPVDRIAEPLTAMGADVTTHDGLPPVTIRAASLSAKEHRLPIASAQVKSCLLLAGLLADGETTVVEPSPTRDHTERMLRAAGADLRTEDAGTSVVIHGSLPAQRVAVRPGPDLNLDRIEVPGDISSAAFMIAAAVLVAGSEVRIESVGLNPTRVGLLGILNRMGAPVEVEEGTAAGGEPQGAITARHGPLEATRVGGDEVPLAIDELPLVALLGCFAEGETVVSDAGELRRKESDRIATVVDGLAALGAEIEATGDGFAVTGGGGLHGGALDAHGDHRLAMLGAVAGLASAEGVEVRSADAAAVSYPGFERDLGSLLGSGSA